MVEPGQLLPRELEPTGKPLLGGTRMKVLQWNVLADGLSGNCEGSGGFTRLPAEFLEFKARHAMQRKHIEESNADIVALQEVDHAEEWLSEMAELGYDGKIRTDEDSPCLRAALNEPKLPDGVALFWKRSRLELDEYVPGVDVGGDEGYKSKRLLARLKSTSSGAFIVLANVHLDSRKNDEGVAVRTRQSEGLLADLRQFVQNKEKPASVVFIAGDLNAKRGERCHDVLLAAWGRGLSDAYADAGYADSFTSFKNRTGDYKAGVVKYAVDHLLHSAAAVPVAILKLPQEAEIGEDGLPCANWPSDHVSSPPSNQPSLPL